LDFSAERLIVEVTETADAAIVRAIVDLGHNLALRVVVEGVETDVSLTALREAHCDAAQSFLLARPMAADTLGRRLTPSQRPGALV
jgi:EAL domain-containing protein (putative c-di-GMP-specific phosphodiesterase class I)